MRYREMWMEARNDAEQLRAELERVRAMALKYRRFIDDTGRHHEYLRWMAGDLGLPRDEVDRLFAPNEAPPRS